MSSTTIGVFLELDFSLFLYGRVKRAQYEKKVPNSHFYCANLNYLVVVVIVVLVVIIAVVVCTENSIL